MPGHTNYITPHLVGPPSDDKRWRDVDATMRRHGYTPSGLIETLHRVQESFGYLDSPSLVYVARRLAVPLSKVYGVATFYNFFRMKRQGEHLCVVCIGTACYLKAAAKILNGAEQILRIQAPDTTSDNKVSLVTARCVGACGIAPVVVFDGLFSGESTPKDVETHLNTWLSETISKTGI